VNDGDGKVGSDRREIALPVLGHHHQAVGATERACEERFQLTAYRAVRHRAVVEMMDEHDLSSSRAADAQRERGEEPSHGHVPAWIGDRGEDLTDAAAWERESVPRIYVAHVEREGGGERAFEIGLVGHAAADAAPGLVETNVRKRRDG
jgi:hypothetical protein